ncbi:hypothetical protein CVIRNUC_000252 [Coccomyxa viridis]|uniref:Uncharacterized protein n=1 Tax=Coccomyxa viridis TaxID=1274662 RepID=A0AAV1HU95_9CHLO|nr:hypothetical protein CVIRNUC_000252 [Coccomyxa viridis]
MTDSQKCIPQPDEVIPATPAWDGSLLACCGDPSTPRGWGICCLTFWLPCITHGLNLKILYTVQKAVLGVLLFFALGYVLYCIVIPAMYLTVFKAPDIVACELNVIYTQPTSGPVDPDFGQKLLDCQKPAWIKIWVAVAFAWACAVLLIIYLTTIRMKVRRRLAIPAAHNSCTGFLQDFCTMWWCAACALCQENRTLHKRASAIPHVRTVPTTPPVLPKMEV